MASGDGLLHRGKLTKEIVNGLRELRVEALHGVDLTAVVVSFEDRVGMELVEMEVLAALEAVTFDITNYQNEHWRAAYTAHVYYAAVHTTRVLREVR